MVDLVIDNFHDKNTLLLIFKFTILYFSDIPTRITCEQHLVLTPVIVFVLSKCIDDLFLRLGFVSKYNVLSEFHNPGYNTPSMCLLTRGLYVSQVYQLGHNTQPGQDVVDDRHVTHGYFRLDVH